MIIRCTNKLFQELTIENKDYSEETYELFSWHANIIRINRRKIVVLMNDSNRYAIVLYGLRKNNFKRFDSLVKKAIKEVFLLEDINPDVIDDYFEKAGEIKVNKNTSRSKLTQLTYSIRHVAYHLDIINENVNIQKRLSYKISRATTKMNGNYVLPIEMLSQDLKDLSTHKLFKTKAIRMKIKLAIEELDLWREIIIPRNYSFEQLHKIIQILFSWLDYHLHEFFIYDINDRSFNYSFNHPAYHEKLYQPIINLKMDDEYFEFDDGIDIRQEQAVDLSEYLNDYKTPFDFGKYIYDDGDFWEHYIIIEEFIEDFDQAYPICTDGRGTAPPEDVGGSTGYLEFLEVMADENHPEYEHYKEWSSNLGYEPFNSQKINAKLLKKFKDHA